MTLASRTPWQVGLAALGLTVAAATFVFAAGRERDEARFENAVQNAEDRVRNRLGTYVALLEGARAFFGSSDSVTAADFRRYVATVDVRNRYPGIQGLGFSRRLAPGDTATVFAARRRDGLRDFQLSPLFERAEIHSIIYLEPQDERNRAAMGFDMFTEPVRSEAMSRARDSGRATMSGRVRLLQEIEGRVQPGFLIYVPVYRGGELPESLDERRRALLGVVYAPLRSGDLFGSLFGAEESPRIALRIHDDGPRDSTTLLFESDTGGLTRHAGLRRVDSIDIAGRRWQVEFSARDDRGPLDTARLTLATAVIGLLVAIVLFRVSAREAAARAAAERSEAARSRFFAAMSHELRTPINAILGYNDLVLAGIYGPITAPQAEAVTRGQRAARHLLELVNDVLDLSKIEAGKIDVVPEPVDVTALLDDMMSTIEPMAASRGCELRRDSERCEIVVQTDPRRVRQVLLNLLSNATKFGAGHPVTLRCRRSDDGVMVEVRDEGPGIAEADVPRIFDEFVQLAGTEGGTGLGLAISRRLAQLLGGRLEVDTAPGQGSTFRLVLPHRGRWTGSAAVATVEG